MGILSLLRMILAAWWSYSKATKFMLTKELLLGTVMNAADVGTDAKTGYNHIE